MQSCEVTAPQNGNAPCQQRWSRLCLEMMALEVHWHQLPYPAGLDPLQHIHLRQPPSEVWGQSNKQNKNMHWCNSVLKIHRLGTNHTVKHIDRHKKHIFSKSYVKLYLYDLKKNGSDQITLNRFKIKRHFLLSTNANAMHKSTAKRQQIISSSSFRTQTLTK